MKKKPVMDNLILLVLLLAAMNIFLNGIYLILVAFVLVMFRDRKLMLDKSALLLVAFAAVYILFFAINNGVSTTLFRVLVLPIAYIMGFSQAKQRDRGQVNWLIIAISCAMAAHSLINLAYGISIRGIDSFQFGISYDFWSKRVSSATGQAACYFFLAGLLPYVLFAYRQQRSRMVLFAVYILALLHDLLLGGRTFLVLSLISCAYGIVLSFIFSKNRGAFLRVVLILVAIALAVHIVFTNNLFGIQKVISSSNFYHRFVTMAIKITDTGRRQRRLIYLENMLQYPFGGNHIRVDLGVGYAHDLWLDVYDDAGILAMALLCCYTVGMIARLLHYFRRNKDYNTRLLVGGVMLTVLVSFLTEPILAACPINLAMFCLIDGMLAQRVGQDP